MTYTDNKHAAAIQDSENIRASGAGLKRSLQRRHLIMIAIGGTLGTGLFLGSGAALHQAGPGGALAAYIIIGGIVLFVMMALGELATFMPETGAFSTYATRLLDPALGFAFGWNYWLACALVVAAELTACGLIMQFWFPDVPGFYWSVLFLVFIFVVNYFSVRGYGESEYWFSFIKVFAVVAFCIVGFLLMFGVIGKNSAGLSNLTTKDAPFVGGISGVFGVALTAAFSFSGTESVGVAAGESRNPGRDMPSAIRTTFIRILLFYVISIFVIAVLIPYTSDLLANGKVVSSPFTVVFEQAGLPKAASVINFVILVASVSVANSCLYIASRMTFAMAKNGQAPKIFSVLSSRNIPLRSLIFSTIFGGLSLFSSVYGNGIVFTWLLNSVGITTFIYWIGILACQWRFRRAYIRQGYDVTTLKYRAKLFPAGTLISALLLLFLLLGQGYTAFLGSHVDWYSVIAIYLGIPVFLVLWFGYKTIARTRFKSLEECELHLETDLGSR